MTIDEAVAALILHIDTRYSSIVTQADEHQTNTATYQTANLMMGIMSLWHLIATKDRMRTISGPNGNAFRLAAEVPGVVKYLRMNCDSTTYMTTSRGEEYINPPQDLVYVDHWEYVHLDELQPNYWYLDADVKLYIPFTDESVWIYNGIQQIVESYTGVLWSVNNVAVPDISKIGAFETEPPTETQYLSEWFRLLMPQWHTNLGGPR